mgnify:CR=1 FL=1
MNLLQNFIQMNNKVIKKPFVKKEEHCATSFPYIDLQFFAEGQEKTEKATPRKRTESRKKGQVIQSKEINSAVVLLMVLLTIKFLGGHIFGQVKAMYDMIFTKYVVDYEKFDIFVFYQLFMDLLLIMARMIGPILAVAVISGFIVQVSQVGFLFTTETIKFKPEKISPISGFKKMFSMRSFADLIKSALKVIIIGSVTYFYIASRVSTLFSLVDMEPMNIAIFVTSTGLNVGIRICIAMLILAIFDYMYQTYEHEKSLKMTKHEVKEEHKQVEGDPLVKQRIKRKQRQISMMRMMQEVPKADVVITNPTHYAVAIKYDPEVSSAPVVLAKGQDYIALRIKEIAGLNDVHVVENKSLAKTLYETVEIGQFIPPELYQAVAEVLAFVYSLKKEGKAG